MTQILTTASGNFDNKKSWAGLKKHLEHDPKLNHKNKYLNTNESKALRKYNRHAVLIDYDKFCEKNFLPYVEDHDAHIKDKKRQFGSVKRFLEVDNTGKSRKLQPAQLYTEKFSDEKSYKNFTKTLFNTVKKQFPEYSDDEVKKRAYKIVNAGLMVYANGFNKRNPHLKMFEYYTHIDELGAPHLHSRVMPFVKPNGTTKKGRRKKPSWSLNRALGAQYGNFGKNKENLKKFRQQEDEAMIDAMNFVLAKTCDFKKPVFKLIRKTDKNASLETGLSHEVYKAKEQKIDELNAQIQAKQNTLKLATDSAKKMQDKKKAMEEQNKKIIKKQVEREQTLKAREMDLHASEFGGVDSRGIIHESLKKRREALKARETRLIERELNVKNHEIDVKAKETGGYDSKGRLHKSIEQRVTDGIKAGAKKVLRPLKSFKHAFLSSFIHQQFSGVGVDEQLLKEIVKQQEDTYGKAAMTAVLSGASGKKAQSQAVKAVGAGALAMAKDIPTYSAISDAIRYATHGQEKDETRRKAKEVSTEKDITDDNF